MNIKFTISLLAGAFALAACSSSGSGSTNALNKNDIYGQNTGTEFLAKRVSTQKDGQLVLGKADFNGSSSGQSGYDAGMNAYKDGSIDNKAFSAVKGYDSADEKTSVYLRDPAVTGWQYQTFGQVIDNQNHESKGYISIGKAYTPADTATINATYQGIAMGTYDQSSEVIGTMSADLKFGANQKTLDVTVSDSKIALNNATASGYTGIKDDARFNFQDQMTWDSNKKAFESNTAQAHLFGKDAAEVGGIFERTVDGKAFQGAFGGKKQ